MNGFVNQGDLIDRQLDPDKLAVLDLGGEGGERRYTFAALDALACSVARALKRDGLARGDRVAILSANRVEFLAVLFGAMRAGLVPVPVNYRFPRSLIHHVLQDCGARVLFCDAQRLPDCPADMRSVVFGSASSTQASAGFDGWVDPGPFATVVPQAGEPAMFLYTSGSTGKPKGVVLSHESHLWVVRTRMRSQDLSAHRLLIAAPLYHMNALALSQLACASHATIVLLPEFTAKSYAQAIETHRCTWLTAVPPMIAMMLRDTELVSNTDFSSVRFLRMGSAPVSPALHEQIRALLPDAVVINAYGTTEGGPVVFGAHPDGLPQPMLSVGYPHPDVRVRLVDGESLDADQGVLQMSSPALMTGYHNRPDLRPPFTADGYYVTGDVFRRDEHGFHYFVGRIDDMFVCGGENVYPADVERTIESHPAVAQACVVPVDDDIKGKKPVAFCVLKPGARATSDEIRQHTLDHGPAYQHPRFVWILERLPLATTGKVDRDALLRAARERIGGAPGPIPAR